MVPSPLLLSPFHCPLRYSSMVFSDRASLGRSSTTANRHCFRTLHLITVTVRPRLNAFSRLLSVYPVTDILCPVGRVVSSLSMSLPVFHFTFTSVWLPGGHSSRSYVTSNTHPLYRLYLNGSLVILVAICREGVWVFVRRAHICCKRTSMDESPFDNRKYSRVVFSIRGERLRAAADDANGP